MALDPRELLNSVEETVQTAFESWQASVWTAMPGVVVSVNWAKMTVKCQVTIQIRIQDQLGEVGFHNIDPLVDVPIVFPSAGGFTITMPIAAGDEILVVIASRCIDSWWQNGWSQFKPCPPLDYRMHDISDGFAIPGPKSVPHVIPSISTTDLQIRNNVGTTFLSIGADGKIGFTNATTSLKDILTDLESLLNTFMTTLAGFSGGGSPVTQAMLQAPAAAAETALVPVLVKIGALLK